MENYFSGVIMGFREGLEAFLIIGIMLRFVTKLGKQKLKRNIYQGALTGVAVSLIFGVILVYISSIISDQGQVSKLWESIASIIALALVTTFIVWMIKNGKNMVGEVEGKLAKNMNKLGIFLVALTVVAREGAEIAIFAFTGKYSIISIATGLFVALLITVLVFYSLIKVNLRTLFSITLLYLILQAGFLIGYGIHEGLSALEVMKVVPEDSWLMVKAFNLSGTIFNHKEGIIGLPLYVIFGWYSKPEWIQFIVQYLYTFTLGFYWYRNLKK